MEEIHLHAAYGPCLTVCGLPCDRVEIAYRGLDLDRVTCQSCLADKERGK